VTSFRDSFLHDLVVSDALPGDRLPPDASFGDTWFVDRSVGDKSSGTPSRAPATRDDAPPDEAAPRVSPFRQASLRETPFRGTSSRESSYGLASFYGSGQQTASGERFNGRAMTAAHRTLPFGTRVRVTNVSNGQSVTVRINDRGPFIRGRVIDVSTAAAESLGMVGRGVAKVKLDVVN
jgi:rare lipoprotein A